MNTKQKAEAWLVKTIDVTDLSDEISRELTDAQEILTAMIKEREALLDAAKSGLNAYRKMAETYGGIYGIGSVGVIEKLEQAITLCEKEHE